MRESQRMEDKTMNWLVLCEGQPCRDLLKHSKGDAKLSETENSVQRKSKTGRTSMRVWKFVSDTTSDSQCSPGVRDGAQVMSSTSD